MRKKIIAKGNIHKSDALRALLTDTHPGDVPIVISNDGFYRNMKALPQASVNYRNFVEQVFKKSRPYTIPYRYNILRSDGGARRLSLTHPSSQLEIVEFYNEFGDVLCYLCQRSPASLRAPKKVGSLFFVRGTLSGKNALKGSRIDTVDIENSVSNPASFFSYTGVDRAYKFFNSTEYLRMEKRYSVMHFADVSKCFSSLYTHTLYWAVADIQTAKDNTQALSLPNTFDKLMQTQNYNETNGICVGAEISRIFAEIILGEIDRRIIATLENAEEARRKVFRTDYEFRRYVDDYYIFAKDEKTAEQVLAAIETCLSAFNLHLNGEKTEKVLRPFITLKSRMIRDASASLQGFFERFIETKINEGIRYYQPKRIRMSYALLRFFLDGIKSSCYDNKTGYGATSNYIIGAIAGRVGFLISGFDAVPDAEKACLEDEYVTALTLLLEAAYFFYDVEPSVPSSLRVAQAAIQSYNFLKEKFPDRAAYVAEHIVRWTFQLIKGISRSQSHVHHNCIPLEAINALLVLGEVGRGEVLARRAIREFCGVPNELTYFEIVSYLYCVGSDVDMAPLRETLLERAKVIISGKDNVRIQSDAAHLLLDILSCPYIDSLERVRLLKAVRKDNGLSQLSNAELTEIVSEFERNPWFVDWQGISLLNMIRKKELSAVY